MALQRTAEQIIGQWDKELDQINRLEDQVDESIVHLIRHRPANYRTKMDDESFKAATEAYMTLIRAGGALRASLRELRSTRTRFPGQVLDPSNAAQLLYSACDDLDSKIKALIKAYR